MENVIEKIVYNENLSKEEKVILLKNIIKASHGLEDFQNCENPGLYFSTHLNRETGEIDMILWKKHNLNTCRMTQHEPINYDSDIILEYIKNICLNNSKKLK